MPRHEHPTETCQVCQQRLPLRRLMPASVVRENIVELIREKHPAWTGDGFICLACLNQYRTEYVEDQMEKGLGELDQLEQEVVRSLRASELISDNVNEQFEGTLRLGDRIADRVAAFGGSWSFIVLFAAVLAAWVVINSVIAWWRPFDPYPYILLNLFLSMLAAIQAPVIMMSQNRQEDRDRLRAENDYQVNLKAELEIRTISEKLDQLLHHQWMRLIEIQRIQTEMIEELAGKRRG